VTTVSSATKSVEFGPGTMQPTAIIGERINPTGKSKLQESLRNGDFTLVRNAAERQVNAGAHILDVNVGAPGVNEVEALAKAVEVVMATTDVPLCIDTANPDALAAAHHPRDRDGAEHRPGRRGGRRGGRFRHPGPLHQQARAGLVAYLPRLHGGRVPRRRDA
jgi:hypothetical protein